MICGLWNVKYGMRNVDCGISKVECEMWSVKCGMGYVECGMWSVPVQCALWHVVMLDVQCGVRNAELIILLQWHGETEQNKCRMQPHLSFLSWFE